MKKRTVTLKMSIDGKEAVELTTSQRIVSNAIRKAASKQGEWSVVEYLFIAVDGKVSTGKVYNR